MELSNFRDLSSNLTRLYSETKKSALNNTVKEDVTPALSSLHRKFRIQKDRLITWGLEWSDQGNSPEGNIDESVARAGLTETVTSVLENIKEVLAQAEQIRSSTLSTHSQTWPSLAPREKMPLGPVDQNKYKDLVKDLTDSIDTLYDLSRSRRALATGSHPSFTTEPDADKHSIKSEKLSLFHSPSFASSELTLVNPPSFTRPNLSPYAGLPPHIDPAALLLPNEEPPPYDTSGAPFTSRMAGRLLGPRISESVRNLCQNPTGDIQVLVEYANFDALYRETGVPPPLKRLEGLSTFLQQSRSRLHLSLLGYFEDLERPRIGLVYDLSGIDYERAMLNQSVVEPDVKSPVSLLRLLQSASKTAKSSEGGNAIPSLEARFRVALQVTESLKDMHANEFPHGNVNSGSVTFITDSKTQQVRSHELRKPVLCAIELFSMSRVERHNSPLTLNIYKHPKDQDKTFNTPTAIKYDMFGLGLLLLEIGLWTPLGDLYKAKYQLSDFKVRLEKIWIPRLASKCGSVYMRIVETCLRFSDEHEGNLPLERVYENIMGRLNLCCLLDEDEPVALNMNQRSVPAAPTSTWSDPMKKSKKKQSASSRVDQINRTQSFDREPPNISFSPPSSAPYRLASLPNLTAPVPMAMAGLAAKPEDAKAPGTIGDGLSLLKTLDGLSRSKSVSSNSDLKSMDTIKEGLSTAATSFQQAWRLRRESSTISFREYRRKVMLIQACWRERRSRLSPTTSLLGQSDGQKSPEHGQSLAISNQLTGEPLVKSNPRIFPVSLPQKALDDWHTKVGLRLSQIVERALKDSPESSAIDLVGLGSDMDTARATILVTCASTAKVRAAIRRKFDYDRDVFDLKIRKGRVSLSRGPRRKASSQDVCKRSSGRESVSGESDDASPENPYWQQRPLCGASIGAYLPDFGHLLPVSYGGVILVDDKPYGMSVHHMLEPPSDDESDAESGASDSDSNFSNVDSDDNNNASRRAARSSAQQIQRLPITSRRRSSRSISPLPSPFSIDSDGASISSLIDSDDDSDDDDDEDDESSSASAADYFSSDFDSDVSSINQDPSATEPGDTPPYLPPLSTTSATPRVLITQPALTDALSQNLHLPISPTTGIDQADQDSDHLLSYRLGRLHASSGLRRTTRAGIRHEIDWALLELDLPRLQPWNLIQGGRRYCSAPAPATNSYPKLKSPVGRTGDKFDASQDLYPASIAPATTLGNLDVLCLGRTSGLQTGRIGAGMSFVKIYGRTTFSSSWAVVGGGFGIGGDSGAWVVDGGSGAVCGHVIAEKGGLTYICPMEILIEDIRATLGATRVGLPGAVEEEEMDVVGGNEEEGGVELEVSPTVSEKSDILADVVESLTLENGKRTKSRAMHSRLKDISATRTECGGMVTIKS